MQPIDVSTVIPTDLSTYLRGGKVGIGYDVASSIKKKSNPSALALVESDGLRYRVPYVVRWKTTDTRINQAIIRAAITAIPAHLRQGLSIDASNEYLAAVDMQRAMAGLLPVHLVKGGSSLDYKGATYKAKTLLGNLYLNLFLDNLIALPPDPFIYDDHRQVMRNGSEFEADVASDGAHADVFDACKHGLWTFECGTGPTEISAVDTVSPDSRPRHAPIRQTPLMRSLQILNSSTHYI